MLNDDMILTIEKVMQEIDNKRDHFPDNYPDMTRRDSSGGYYDPVFEDIHRGQNPNNKILSRAEKNEALKYIQEFVEIGLSKAKDKLREGQPKPKRKTIPIQDIINGTNIKSN